MIPDSENSLSDEATFAGSAKRQRSDVSIGDERTLGDGLSGQDTIIDDIEVVDLEARYKIEGTLGQGGMGAVLLATDTRLDRRVAIKRILGEAVGNRMAVNRFLTEAKSIAALNHPNIVQIYDYGQAKDGPFLIMEFVDGGSLLDRCRDGAMPLESAVDLACQLCDGLAKAHDLGIIHRDIKPANVLLTKDGTPKLTDFGLAKAQTEDHGQTMTGAVLGTPDFMPPEQRRDASLVDARSDLWSLAATVYQMLTGRSPKIIRFKDVPESLQDVLGKALEDEKDSRYQSAREFREAIQSSLRNSNAVETSIGEGQCPGCGTKNDSSRRFCRNCGGSLEATCLACTKPMPMWEDICGQCGSQQQPIIEARRADMVARQSEAERSLEENDFDEARSIASALLEEPDPRLRQLMGWAERFLPEIEKKRDEKLALSARSLSEALRHEKAFDYSSGIHALEIVPEILHGRQLPGQQETVAGALARLSTKQAESRRLDGLIKASIAGRELAGLLPQVEKLLVLRPDREDVQKLKKQLEERQAKLVRQRDEVIAKAQKAMSSRNYQEAAAMLAAVDESASTPEVESLAIVADTLWGRVQELVTRIKSAVADKRYDGLLRTVDELLELMPDDQEAQKLRQSLLTREMKTAADVAAIEAQAFTAWKALQFAQAAKLIDRIPIARRSDTASSLLAAYVDMSMAQSAASNALKSLPPDADVAAYDAAIDKAWHYQSQLERWSLTDKGLNDALPRYLQARESLIAKGEKEAQQRRFMQRSLLATMMVALAIVTAVGGLWFYRAQSMTTAVSQRRWDDALAIEPDNAAALVGRAQARLAATPADVEGALSDLDLAERTPDAAGIVQPTRAEAHAVRAVEQAQADRLDQAVEDLRAATTGGAAPALLSRAQEAIAKGWIGRGVQAVASEDATVVRSAADSAVAAGAESGAVLGIWREYVKRRVVKLDGKGMGDACAEARKVGLTGQEEAEWWILFGETASSPPHENAAEVIRAVDAAVAAGADARRVAPLRARGLVLEALVLESKGDLKTAVAGMLAASLLDAAYVQTMLEQPAYAPLRKGMVAEHRGRFDAAAAGKDWQEAFRIAAAAQTLDKEAAAWVSKAVAALPLAARTELPPTAMAALPPAALLPLPPLRNSIGMKFKLLPAGMFTMGQVERAVNETADEKPHTVTLTKVFYLSVYEVTNEQWKRVMGSVPSEWQDDDRPVEQITVADAVEFCRRLSELPNERAAGRAYRLPTEAEWEYACRAGTTTLYSFGDDESRLSEYAWFGDLFGGTHQVGTKKPNAWGLYDMHGNVGELCSDWYGTYPDGAATDPQGPSGPYDAKSYGVSRGGYWFGSASDCRSACRGMASPAEGFNFKGFRPAMHLLEANSPEAQK